MRFVTIDRRIHALTATGPVDLAPVTGLPGDPAAFFAADGLEATRRAFREGALEGTETAGTTADLSGLTLDAPVPQPRVVWCIGLNYRDHAAETGKEIPAVPTVFVKSPGAVIAPGATIEVPPFVTQPDYEGELAVVIGKRARDVAEADALEYVAGVTVAHDVSARDHQYVTTQWCWSKSYDTFCPMGPVLVTIDELDVTDLPISTRIGSEVLQDSNTGQMVFPVAHLISFLSQGTTLEPGDVILTGTPAGVGLGRTPPRWLQDGETVEITIGGIGTLSNPVRRSS
ncbi:MAG: fumarylacetoacetate hydrolase family protein [Actinomycetia bacterium]|nr:fumarylacetoacetate hydrolase family protein [Actinomycetes bacterium]